MKIPLILAQKPIAQPARQSAGGAVGAGQGEALLAEGLGSLSRAFQQVSHTFQVADAQRQKLDDQIQRGVILAQLGEDVTGGLQELRLTGLEPEQYEAEGARLIQQHVQAAQQQIRNPQGQQRFQLDAAQFTAKARSEVKTDAYKGKLARMGVEAVGSMTRHANETVWGVTPEAQAEAYAKGVAMPEQMLRTGVWSADEAKAQRAQFLGQVERGSIDRDARNPALVGDVLNLLSRGAYSNIPAHEQSTILDGLLGKGNAARVEADRLRKEQQEENERGLALRIRDAATPEALAAAEDEVRGLMSPGMRGLQSEKGEHFFKQIDVKRNPPAEDDPATVKALQIPVYALKATEAAVAAMAGRVDSALENGKLKPDTHRTYMNQLEQQLARIRTSPVEKLLADEHRDIEAAIPRLLRTKGPMSQDFDVRQQAITEEAIAEFQRSSSANGGTEKPRDWWDRRRPYYVARQLGMAREYALGVLSGIPVAYQPVGGFNPDKPEETLKAINQVFQKLRDDMLVKARLGQPPDHIPIARQLNELLKLNQELARLKWQREEATDGAKGTTPPAAAKPGQVTGRPR